MAYDNSNTGALFRAKDKKTDKHPDYDGTITVNGVEFWLSGWRRTSKNGTDYLSLSVKPKQQPESAPKRPSQDGAKARQLAPRSQDDFDEPPF